VKVSSREEKLENLEKLEMVRGNTGGGQDTRVIEASNRALGTGGSGQK
jgi:hypothetical protein